MATPPLAGTPPLLPLQMHPQQTLLKIRTQEVNYPAHLSPGAVSFMRLALVRDPAQRATMDQLLAHPWVVGLMARSGGRRAGGVSGWGRAKHVGWLEGSVRHAQQGSGWARKGTGWMAAGQGFVGEGRGVMRVWLQGGWSGCFAFHIKPYQPQRT
jgi:hypothetical protein